jgi:hypothetical protein
MKTNDSLSVSFETGAVLYTGNNNIRLVILNASPTNYKEVIIRFENSAKITLPAKLKVSPLRANTSELIACNLYATEPGWHEIKLHISAFPSPRTFFLPISLVFEVLPKPERPTFLTDKRIARVPIAPHKQSSIPKTLNDPYAHYEVGLRRLLERIGPDHSRYVEALGYEGRFIENIKFSRRYGDNENQRAGRAELIERLNELALSVLKVSFTSLCK